MFFQVAVAVRRVNSTLTTYWNTLDLSLTDLPQFLGFNNLGRATNDHNQWQVLLSGRYNVHYGII